VIVFKQEERHLMREALALRRFVTPTHVNRHGTACRVWDIPACDGWDACPYPVCVIISDERNSIVTISTITCAASSPNNMWRARCRRNSIARPIPARLENRHAAVLQPELTCAT